MTSRQVRVAALQGLRLFVDKLEKHSETMATSGSGTDPSISTMNEGIFGWALGSLTGTISKKVRPIGWGVSLFSLFFCRFMAKGKRSLTKGGKKDHFLEEHRLLAPLPPISPPLRHPSILFLIPSADGMKARDGPRTRRNYQHLKQARSAQMQASALVLLYVGWSFCRSACELIQLVVHAAWGYGWVV